MKCFYLELQTWEELHWMWKKSDSLLEIMENTLGLVRHGMMPFYGKARSNIYDQYDA